ncbi:MAG: hypothetical protein A2659_01185 [Candidatus Yanofskybacteria bacterium RIFCSPHIGHO2_01_FULL_44_24]|nr:MAG: hypothetical protein A2659_01185 [Candidatus Yanofskybacteria bacterium RIFCSPHIGHO2_01_FULL_44_24]
MKFDYLFNCFGPDLEPIGVSDAKIRAARKLFTRTPLIGEPIYFVKKTHCYNGWAGSSDASSVVVISQAVMDEFSIEELAGLIGHEIAHLENPLSNREHWEVDLRGAELTTKELMIKKLEKMAAVYTDIYDKNMIFGLPALRARLIVRDFRERLEKIKTFAK